MSKKKNTKKKKVEEKVEETSAVETAENELKELQSLKAAMEAKGIHRMSNLNILIEQAQVNLENSQK